ncbi:calcium-binding protein [Inquilinus sp. OTU3971]|uniref:calcium-binding protein n=1 Tax=Inquilinus sp. OTU3971 TaxID=3043855 RepID=UPI00313B1F16
MPVFWGTAAADRILGSAAADQIYGQAGDDTLYGAAGNDWLNGGLGSDLMVGGLGDDVYYVATAGDGVVERAGEGTDSVLAWVSYQLAANVEHLTLSGTADLSGAGNALNNTILGNVGNNVLNGGAGSDTLVGGKGNDVYDVDSAGDRVQEAANEGYDRVRASVSFALGANLEELNLTGTAAINGTGNALANTIVGNTGNNVLNGAAGDDVLIGGKGDDIYLVGAAGDRVVEQEGEGADQVLAWASHQLSADVETLILQGAAAINGTGNALANTIVGNAGANVLDGGTGDDVLAGGAGDDIYIVDRTNRFSPTEGDVISEARDGGIDLVRSSVDHVLAANVENLALTGPVAVFGQGNALDNIITGNAAANKLEGGAGNDTLSGGDGADQLNGGAGRDLLYGGAGNDTLYVEIAQVAAGEVYDGGAGSDGIVIRSGIIDLFTVSLVGVEFLTGSTTETVNISCQQINGLQQISVATLNVHDAGSIDLSDMVAFSAFNFNLSDFGNIVNFGSGFVGPAVTGGAGNDMVIGGSRSSGGGGDDTLIASAHSSSLRGWTGDDVLIGDVGGDLLYDGAGADDVRGGDGNDVLFVFAGDTVAGDRYDGGVGRDVLSISYAVSVPSVDISQAQISNFESIEGIGVKILMGADQLDSLHLVNILASKIDIVSGGSIDLRDLTFAYRLDITLSSAGNTLITGDKGHVIVGREGNDNVTGGTAGDSLSGGAGDDVLDGGSARDVLDGGLNNDRLLGGAGDDILIGNNGDDILIGGIGTDTLIGGAGQDRFIISAIIDGPDLVTDFSSAQGDKLAFQGLLHGTFSYLGAAAFSATGNSEARFAGGVLVVDTNGNGTADITLSLTGITSASQLHATDFIFS